MAKRNLPPWDDGRVIAPMEVEGMPWHKREKPDAPDRATVPTLSGRETRWVLWGSLKAVLLIGGVFSLGIVAFVGLLLWAWA